MTPMLGYKTGWSAVLLCVCACVRVCACVCVYVLALLKLGMPETSVEIVRSFHDNMKGSVRVFEVTNVLRQGCMMALTLFNLYACVAAER